MKRKFIRWFGRKLVTLVRNAEADLQRDALAGFANKPENLLIESPSRIINAKFITVGDNVSLGPGCMLNAIRRYPGQFLSDVPDDVEIQYYEPTINIGNRVSATGYLTVSAVESVTIEDDVIFASSVFIADHSHGRSRTDVAYKYQPLQDIEPVRIGRGCWIGEHVVVMPGVEIGEFSIIGANSIVTRDIPPKSIAVGSPIKVVKVWDKSLSDWIKQSDS